MKRILFVLFLLALNSCDKCKDVVCAPCPEGQRSFEFKWSLDSLNNGFRISEVDTFYLSKIDKASSKRIDTIQIVSLNGKDFYPNTGLGLFSHDSLNFTIGEDTSFNYEIFISDLISYQITDLTLIGNGPPSEKSCCWCFFSETKTALVNGQLFDFKIDVFVLKK